MLQDLTSTYCETETVSYSGAKLDPSVELIYQDNYQKKDPLINKSLSWAKNTRLGNKARRYYQKIKKFDLSSYEEKIKQADVLIIGGGNMIFDLDEFSLSAIRFDKFIKIAKKYNKKVFAISLGIGPFQTKQQELEAVKSLSKCDYITFRDQASLDIFNKYKKGSFSSYLSIDPVFLLPNQTKKIENEDKIIGLNIINSKLIGDNVQEYEKVINEYAELADRLTKKIDVKIILFSTELSDYPAVYDVYDKLRSNEKIKVCYITEIDGLLDLYSSFSLLIGTRMHSMIIAFTQQIPIIGFSWQKKVEAMFEIIDSKECLFNYNEIGVKTDEIIFLCQKKLTDLNYEKEQIVSKLKKIRDKDNINKEILLKLMS